MIDILWVLISASLVFLMQPGFMCLESGLTRPKNSINVAVKNLTDFIFSVMAFWTVGYGLMFGLSLGVPVWNRPFFCKFGGVGPSCRVLSFPSHVLRNRHHDFFRRGGRADAFFRVYHNRRINLGVYLPIVRALGLERS